MRTNEKMTDTAETRAPSVHNEVAVEAFRRAHRIDPDRIRRMRHALYQGHESVDSALRRLDRHGPSLAAGFLTQVFEIQERFDSQIDQSSKWVLKADDGIRVETVLLRARSGRSAVCISTQAGCRAGCPFCATARLGLRRSLTGEEMVEQVLIAGRAARVEGRRVRNVVFMGMGEPLDNEASLHAAVHTLTDPGRCNYRPRRLLVSTVGVPSAMRRLVDSFPGVQVALSLHSARPELREKLVPWTRRHSWVELRDALAYVAAHHRYHRHQGSVMVEHILIDRVNDGDDDADALIEYLQGIPSHVNLIPHNPVDHAPQWRATPRERRDKFAEKLRRAGIFTTIRYSMGMDINAACGQLVAADGPSAEARP